MPPSTSPWAETLWRRVKRIHEQDQIRSEPDGELLQRFAESRDETAFEELLRRHGPLVWGVCVRTLGFTPEAEDAFQAVFLILVRKAGRILHQSQIAGWLYGTAQKVVRRARKQRLRRDSRESQQDTIPELGRDSESPHDWLPLLDHAVQKLPEKYREVLILCELQQRTRSEVARLLSLNENTLSSRLARAKEMLRAKLAPTGLGLPAGLVSITLVPTTLVSATLQLSVKLAADAGSLSKILPLALLPLVQGGSKLMLISKSLTCLAVGVLVTLGLMNNEAIPQGKGEPPAKTQPLPPQQAIPEATKPTPKVWTPPPATKDTNTDLSRMQGKWHVKSYLHRNVGEKKPDPKIDESFLFGKDCEISDVWFRGKEIWILLKGMEGVIGTFSLGETFDPHRIDFTLPQKDVVDFAWNAYGVYAFSAKEELTILFGPDRLNRPTLEKEGNPPVDDEIELVLERQVEPAAQVPEEFKELLGEWKVTGVIESGTSPNTVGMLEFTPNSMVLSMISPKETMRFFVPFSYKINSSRNPRWINLDLPKGAFELDNFPSRGIYSVTGDTLKIALGKKNRPSDFESPSGSEILLLTASRIFPNPQPVGKEKIVRENRSPNRPEAVADPNLLEIDQPKIMLPFQINDSISRDVKTAILWVSYDHGQTFKRYAERQLHTTNYNFEFETLESGEVHFAVQTVNRQDVTYPPTNALKSQLKVRFKLPNASYQPFGGLKLEYAPVKDQTPVPVETNPLQKENRELRERLDQLMKRVEQLEKAEKAKFGFRRFCGTSWG